MRTVKEELLWLRESSSVRQLHQAVTTWVAFYNSAHLHSTLGYQTPNRFEADHLPSHRTQFDAT